MKTTIMITAIILFLIAFAFSGLKIRQVKKVTREKTEMETRYAGIEKEKKELEKDLLSKKNELFVLKDERDSREIRYKQQKEDSENEIRRYKERISELTSLPPDTVYQVLFAKWPSFNQPLVYSFSESQIRGIHLNVIERDHYLLMYDKAKESLITCEGVNTKNGEIISNLTTQNTMLETKNTLSGSQIDILKDELKLSTKVLNKQKRKTFLFKGTTFLELIVIIVSFAK